MVELGKKVGNTPQRNHNQQRDKKEKNNRICLWNATSILGERDCCVLYLFDFPNEGEALG